MDHFVWTIIMIPDVLVASAKAHGIRLIIALTNSWPDFGGMDAAYKTYIQAVVSRYVNEPTVMAWELANEPRCAGTNTVASATCNTTTITTWVADISAFIKSIDKNHLVAIGDEGFFNQPGNPDFVYQGTLGVDFAANMKISTILEHSMQAMYPDSWGESANDVAWGSQWINDHAAIMTSQNKPVIMEEYGLTSSTRNTTYATWYSTVLSSGLTGDLIWQAGSVFANGPTPSDGYSIYPTDPVYALMKSPAAALKARG
ncbi:endo-beta-mannanase [Mycena olivaceomarginata]|nr:endo-beta-mannanase [Mycena olivaceomarginata]